MAPSGLMNYKENARRNDTYNAIKTAEKLEEEGLIERIEYQQIPPKVEYKLSNIGEKFRKVLKELEIWGNEYIQYLNDKEC